MKKLICLLFVLNGLYANAQCWQKVTGGYNHTIALRTDGLYGEQEIIIMGNYVLILIIVAVYLFRLEMKVIGN